MAEIITTLHKKGDASVDVYPNIKSDNIPNGAITNAKIADNAISTAKLQDTSVTTAKIADGAVTFNKIADGAIGFTKIEDGAVTSTKIQDGAITDEKIENETITPSKLSFDLYLHNIIFNVVKNSITYQFHLLIPLNISTPLTKDNIDTLLYRHFGDEVVGFYLINGEGNLKSYADDIEVTIYSHKGVALSPSIENADLSTMDSYSVEPYTPIPLINFVL